MLLVLLLSSLLSLLTFVSSMVQSSKVRISMQNTESFYQFSSLPPWLVERCASQGYNEPTVAQRMAIPSILKGNDVILQSETGSGKTLAYSLPILASVDASRASIQAVIILPSRELGLQVSSVLRQLASGAPKKIYIMPLVDGSQNRRQQLWLTADPPHIVVGTPKSIKKLVDMGRLRLNAVSYIVMDEIDACLADHESRRILHQLLSQQLSSTYQTVKDSDASITDEILLSNLAKKQRDAMTVDPKYRINRQTIICSATIQQRQHFMSMCHQQGWTETIPELIHVSNACLVPKNIKHEYVICQATHKLACLKYLIKKEIAVDAAMQGIIFVDDTSQLDKVLQSVTKLLADHYGTKEILARGLSEDMNIDDRAVVLSEFKENKYKLLVCTDIISRGIDIPSVSHVFQPTLPGSCDSYIHRSGRTGRYGRDGKVITIINEEEKFVIERYSNEINTQFQERKLKLVD